MMKEGLTYATPGVLGLVLFLRVTIGTSSLKAIKTVTKNK